MYLFTLYIALLILYRTLGCAENSCNKYVLTYREREKRKYTIKLKKFTFVCTTVKCHDFSLSVFETLLRTLHYSLNHSVSPSLKSHLLPLFRRMSYIFMANKKQRKTDLNTFYALFSG